LDVFDNRYDCHYDCDFVGNDQRSESLSQNEGCP
ncbi:hypothetical protein T4D_7107, partial [Trichinella pseudospiralis]